ncbi:hypothetical protein ACFWPA_09055 [Rhodococcus sp. NPDC058505]|uniref:hypothetical protein n=1 Tax=Rhodococcus sp. NPDC058505 TaxID=3346531 RepID=UPI003646180E
MTDTAIGWIGDPDPSAAEWVFPYRYPDALAGGGWLADRFGPLLQILHPAYLDGGAEPTPVSWAAIAAACGTTLSPGATFMQVAAVDGPNAVVDGVFDDRPEMGSVPVELVPALYEHFPDAGSGLMWAGWAGFLDEEIRGCARVREPDGLEYQVIAATRVPGGRVVRSRTPNFWWPRDRSWCAATGIDDEHTLVAAADRSRLEAVHADPRLETLLFP